MTASAPEIRAPANDRAASRARAGDLLDTQRVAWLEALTVELERVRSLAETAPTWQERMAARRLLLDGAVRLGQVREPRKQKPARKSKSATTEPPVGPELPTR